MKKKMNSFRENKKKNNKCTRTIREIICEPQFFS